MIYWCLLVPTTTWKSTFFQHIFNKLHLALYIRSDILIIFCLKIKPRFLISHLKALYNCVTSWKFFIVLNHFFSRKCQINIYSDWLNFFLTKFLIDLNWYIFTQLRGKRNTFKLSQTWFFVFTYWFIFLFL